MKNNSFLYICYTIYGDRPPLLQGAMAAAYSNPYLAHWSLETRAILLSLIARLSRYKPWDTFHARADRCAEEVGVSRKTFTRAIARFIDEGWLNEDGGGRSPSGRFGAFGYRFSRGFLGMIGLDKGMEAPQASEGSKRFLYADAPQYQPQNQQASTQSEPQIEEGQVAAHEALPIASEPKAQDPVRADINPLPKGVEAHQAPEGFKRFLYADAPQYQPQNQQASTQSEPQIEEGQVAAHEALPIASEPKAQDPVRADINPLPEGVEAHHTPEQSHGFLYVDVHLKEDHVKQECAYAPQDQPQNQQPSAQSEPRIEDGQVAAPEAWPIASEPKAQAPVRADINPLPSDVVELNTIFGIHPLQVYRLMGLATKAGHRLADLLSVAKEYLVKISATGFRAARYLEAMLYKGTGYKKRSKEQAITADQRSAKTQLERDENEFSNRVFVSAKGGIVDIRRGLALVTTPEGRVVSISGTGMLEVYEHIKIGVLKPCISKQSIR